MISNIEQGGGMAHFGQEKVLPGIKNVLVVISLLLLLIEVHHKSVKHVSIQMFSIQVMHLILYLIVPCLQQTQCNKLTTVTFIHYA